MSVESHEFKVVALRATMMNNLHHAEEVEELLDLLAAMSIGPTDNAAKGRKLLNQIGYYALRECEERLRGYEEKHPNRRAEEEERRRKDTFDL